MTAKFSCREISPGIVEGQVLRSEDQILFYHTEPATGIVTEHGHSLEGVSVRDRILVFPGGKGSSVVQMDGLYKLELRQAAPLAFIVEEPDTVLVSCAIIMGLPMVDQVDPAFYQNVKNGDWVRVDTGNQTIEIVPGPCKTNKNT